MGHITANKQNPDSSAMLFIYMWDDVEKISLKIRMVLHQAEITRVYLFSSVCPQHLFPLSLVLSLQISCLYAFQQVPLFLNGQFQAGA